MSSERKEISIVIPTKEESKTIGKCLHSILDNLYPLKKLEIIVVDGMSDDGTREIVQEYKARFPMIKLIDNSKIVTPVALNIGINNAKGDIIVILGAHSYIDKDFLLNVDRVFS